jgi:hypothetical protein
MSWPFTEFVAWAHEQGEYLPPNELFALMREVRAGRVTLTPREGRIVATIAGVIVAAAPSFVEAVVKQVEKSAPTLNDVGNLQAFVVTVEAHVADAVKHGQPADWHAAMTFVLNAIETGLLAQADVKGQPS